MCFMIFSMNTWRSNAPSLVTSITLFPSDPVLLPLLCSLSNKDVRNCLKAGSLSIAAHCNSSSSSSFVIESEWLLWKLEAWYWCGDWMFFPILTSSIWNTVFSCSLPQGDFIRRTLGTSLCAHWKVLTFVVDSQWQHYRYCLTTFCFEIWGQLVKCINTIDCI